MNNALFIISVQHELAMAIGNKLDLKDMLKVFLKVCFNRLNLTSAHIYTYCDSNGLPIKLATQQSANYQHLLSMPKMKSGLHWSDDEMLIQFGKTIHFNLMKTNIYSVLLFHNMVYWYLKPIIYLKSRYKEPSHLFYKSSPLVITPLLCTIL